jgi:hypothetical protein
MIFGFRLMMWITLAAIPLIFLLRAPDKKAASVDIHAAMD